MMRVVLLQSLTQAARALIRMLPLGLDGLGVGVGQVRHPHTGPWRSVAASPVSVPNFDAAWAHTVFRCLQAHAVSKTKHDNSQARGARPALSPKQQVFAFLNSFLNIKKEKKKKKK